MPFANYEYGLAHRRAYQKTENGKAAHARANKAYRERNKKRYQAHIAVNNVIRDGKLIAYPCFICGDVAHAHHPDYDRPLDVVWLCQIHHKAAHAIKFS